MEQLNHVLPEIREEDQSAAVAFADKPVSPLLDKVRRNFGIFGGISLIFGLAFAVLFYKTGIGLNILIFATVMIVLLCAVMQKLSLTLKTGTKFYYAGVLMLGLSTALTANEALQFFNVVGILFLLDLSLLHQVHQDREWDFLKHFLRMFGMVFQSLASLGMPFADCFQSMKHTKLFKNNTVRNIFLGILIAVPFLWIVTVLLSEADLLFGKLTEDIFDVLFSTELFGVLLFIVIGFLVCYCILCAAVSKAGLQEKKPLQKADASIAVTAMVILVSVYVIFCGIQLMYLFAQGLLELPKEYTFAEYARRGFFELLAVAVINVTLMVVCNSLFKESRGLRSLITAMTACTYIMIASAAYRMFLYIGAYHLTFLRVLVLLSLLILALILAGIILSQYRRSFPLFQYCIVVTAVCYLAFSFSRPDYYIAVSLLGHTQQLKQEDIRYLTYDLSLDAAPVVLPFLTKEKQRIPAPGEGNFSGMEGDYGEAGAASLTEEYYSRIERAVKAQGIRDFNLSKYLAKQQAGEITKY